MQNELLIPTRLNNFMNFVVVRFKIKKDISPSFRTEIYLLGICAFYCFKLAGTSFFYFGYGSFN